MQSIKRWSLPPEQLTVSGRQKLSVETLAGAEADTQGLWLAVARSSQLHVRTVVSWCVLLLNSSLVAQRWQSPPGCGAGAGAGCRAALAPGTLPSAVSLPAHLEHSFNAGFLVVLLPSKDKPNDCWDRLWTAVAMDLAFITT